MTMESVDIQIERLARTSAPPGLKGMEQLVLDRLAGESPVRTWDSLGLSSLAAAVGLALGVAGGAVPLASNADPTLSPLTDASLFPASALVEVR
jgi:hypothetical protein